MRLTAKCTHKRMIVSVNREYCADAFKIADYLFRMSAKSADGIRTAEPRAADGGAYGSWPMAKGLWLDCTSREA